MGKPPNFEINSWLEGEPAFAEYPQLEADLHTDWLIVGAGFTGLAAATHLAQLRPADRIVLIEGSRLGEGSASRSSGFVVSLGHFDGSSRETAALYRLGTAAIAYLREQVQTHHIECDWNEAGRMIAARGNPGLGSLKRIRRALDRAGSGYTPVSSQQIKQTTGMSGYVDGIRQDESIQVNPAKLHRGLVESLPANVEVFEQSPVLSIQRKSHWVAQTKTGSITAKRILLTNNASVTKLGHATNRVFPMQTYIGVFQSPQNESSLFGDEPNWGLTSVERVGSSVRRVKDQLFIRSGAICGFAEGQNSAQQYKEIVDLQRQAMARRFPQNELECINVWSGGIGVTANGSQFFGQAGEGLFLSVGYNGHGIAQGTISGQLLVDLALARESELLHCIQGLPKPWWIPRPSLLYPIVDRYVEWLNWRYGDEI
ncbi:MAG: FAD-binding oxidoreductase [Pirellulaceae bacterium]|nr:FAD-binding oxidoreductase [Pirellulaceae bacterium]